MKRFFPFVLKSSLAIAIVALAALSASPVFAHGGAEITVTPAQGIHGQKVTVSGEGFEEGSQVSITLEGSMGSMSFATTTSDTKGMFNATVAITEDMTPGSYILKAVGGDDTATVDFSISEPAEASPASGSVNNPSASDGNGSVVYQLSLAQTVVIVVALSLLILVGLLLLARKNR